MKPFIRRIKAALLSAAFIFTSATATYPAFSVELTTPPSTNSSSSSEGTSSENTDTSSSSEQDASTDTSEATTEDLDFVTTIDTTSTSTAEDGTVIVDPTQGLPPADISDPNAPEIVANNCIVMDVKTGTILYAKNAYDRCYPASITKVMTCLVALENTDLNSTVTFSNDAIWGIERDSNHIALDVGEQITAEECLYGILLQSANEAAWGMAEHVAGSLEAFADMMNAKAKELGCLNTHFVNANGLHDDYHYTTCYDMALITKAAMENPIFREIDATTYYQIPPTNLKDEPRDLWHQLRLILPSSPYYYEYCEGGKTGYTDQAHNTLTSFAKKNGMELICVMMNCYGAKNCYLDSAALYEYYFNNYTYATPLESYNPNVTDKSDAILSNFYKGLDHDTFHLNVDRDVTIVVPFNTAAGDITTDVTYYDTIDGNVVGNIAIYYKDTLVGTSDITYDDITINGEVLSWGAVHEEQKKTINKIFFIIGAVIIALLIVLFIYIYIKNKRYRYLKRRSKSSKLHF